MSHKPPETAGSISPRLVGQTDSVMLTHYDLLEWLGEPAHAQLSAWMDLELSTLENEWQHASSPQSWNSTGSDRRRGI